MTLAVPRTVRFVRTTYRTREVALGLASPGLTVALAAGVALDEAVMAVLLSPHRLPTPPDSHRVGGELAAARELFAERGWLDDPATYHRRPPPLTNREVVSVSGTARGIAYEQLRYESGFLPMIGEPGRERWDSYRANHRAVANVVRHREDGRPWVICVHGFTMGYPIMDFAGLQTGRLHYELGLNVAMPVLPLHGPRKVTRLSGEPFLSFELMNSIHGFAQAVWDIRRLISWIRQQGATSIGLYGVSLGGYVVSLLAGLEDGLDAVVAGIPVTDVPGLFGRHTPAAWRATALDHGLLESGPGSAHHVVSPMAFPARVPLDRRFIFAGYGDRMAFPEQAHRLWQHWEEPEICWFPGNHVGYLWSR
ncbi:MAG TPA: alpha/beta hydrolase, partial [Acidimicrobiales bacterium]|nr:alpha/beta hydrolase [Acidimicrobiales bacterium]